LSDIIQAGHVLPALEIEELDGKDEDTGEKQHPEK